MHKNKLKYTAGKKFFLMFFLTMGLWIASNITLPTIIDAKKIDNFTAPENFSSLTEMVSPSVVNIRTEKIIKGGGPVFRHFFRGPNGGEDPFQDFFDKFFGEDNQREFKQRSLGSGFIIDKEGHIVTNNHVVENADKIKVKLKDGEEFDAEIIGRDPNTDLALIKISPEHNLPELKLGDSNELKVGQWVVAIGSPFGLEHTVTAGIVSAKGRVIGSGPYDDFIQTDASINPGNSGGPLINMKGEVVGINTAIIAGGQGIGFAIPINLAKGIVDQLKKYGDVTRGWLGVAIQDISGEIAEYYGLKNRKGVLVTEVFPNDPADQAGIKAKDIILDVDGINVETSRELTGIIADKPVGEKVKISVFRNGQKKVFTVEIAKREETRISAKQNKKVHEDELGVRVADITREMASRFNITESGGVIVIGVEPNSKGSEAGMIVGDIIKEINHKAITNVNDYKKIIADIKTGETIQMFIRRMNSGFIVIKLTK
ncbi:MAG: DegQ family serine endoprotease [Desulfobacterales bacterium]|nr:DegQ family serine endoprotease [Desulfobacterales bacterium]